MQADLLSALRAPARNAPESGIVEVANYGRQKPGLIPLWAGEGDLPTPDFIHQAAARALAGGETFYTWQRGIPELRAALARYHRRHFGRSFSPERFFVTGGGMQAIQITIAALAGQGDEVIVPTPSWPNFAAAFGIAGGRPVAVQLDFDGERWSLDLDKVRAAVGPATRAIFINSPANPTGWTANEADLREILAFARERGLWIIADEVYNRFVYDGERAASFYDIAEEGDRIVFVNTFSKNWAMTGWRIGWISAPEPLGQVFENLIQYSTSGVAPFMQRAAIAALEDGEEFARGQVDKARRGREILCGDLAGSNRVSFARPAGAFYLFFRLDGVENTARTGLQLVDEAGIGIAPGTAFGEGGESFMRIAFLRREAEIAEASRRLVNWLGS